MDHNHSVNKRKRRARIGFMINMKSMLREKVTVETYLFGPKFVAVMKGMNAVRGKRYMLKMVGVPTVATTNIFCDNTWVIHHTTLS